MIDAEARAELLDAGASTVYEAAARNGALDPTIRPLGEAGGVAGPALPIICHPGDNLAVHRGVAAAARGEVLMIDGGGVPVAYLGDVLGHAAVARGIAGAVVDGGVRDVAGIEELGFPVWSRSISMRGAAKLSLGRVGEPAVVAGVVARRGDLVVADRDGVVCLPADGLPDLLDAVRRRLRTERELKARLRAGDLTTELLDLPVPPADSADAAR